MRSQFITTALCGVVAGAVIASTIAAFAAKPAPSGTEIVVDKQNGAVTFFIDGFKVASFEATGLHVAGDLTFDGKLLNAKETQGRAP